MHGQKNIKLYRRVDLRIMVQFPGGARYFSLLQSIDTSSGAILPPIQWVRGLCLLQGKK